VEQSKKWLAGEVAEPATIARSLLVSRQSLYKKCKPRQLRIVKPAPRPVVREVIVDVAIGPEHMDVEEALVVLARRHVAYGYRQLWSKLRRAGYIVNRKKVQRLLRLWGYTLTKPRPHPKPQGRPFDISKPNQLWQTDMTAIWCGEDGWAYLTLVTDCFCRSILGWSFSLGCRARDFSPALEMAWSTAFPYGVDKQEIAELVLRHDNGTQFTSKHYREVAAVLGVKLSRTRYRHPDGNALVERIFLSLKREEVWPSEYMSFEQARAAVQAWIDDYNRERPHQSLNYRTPSEVRAAALTPTQSAA
jgi:putative transposase